MPDGLDRVVHPEVAPLPDGGRCVRRPDESDDEFSVRVGTARAAALDTLHSAAQAQAESPLAKFARVWEPTG